MKSSTGYFESHSFTICIEKQTLTAIVIKTYFPKAISIASEYEYLAILYFFFQTDLCNRQCPWSVGERFRFQPKQTVLPGQLWR